VEITCKLFVAWLIFFVNHFADGQQGGKMKMLLADQRKTSLLKSIGGTDQHE
jgi:hypothetical protein